jgi:ribosomal protein S12 methylthiotransferase
MSEAKIDRAGCFKYEPVAGARSEQLGLAAVPEETKQNRWDRFMAHQQTISAARLKTRVGKRLPVIIDKSEGTTATGRSIYDAPEIDGLVHVTSRRPMRVGDILTVKITSSDAYDLHGSVA